MKKSHMLHKQTKQIKVRRKYNDRKEYKENNLEEQSFEEKV